MRYKMEIKFRAWDKKERIMSLPFDLGKVPKDVRINPLWKNELQFEIIQFTGLKDKNRKDICGGDIVEWADRKFLIEWVKKECCFIMKTQKEGLGSPNALTFEQCVIIGNKFENLELLE